MSTTENQRKVRQGRVVSDAMDKTVVVEVLNTKQHSLYKKYLERDSRFHVHDEENVAREGDLVEVRETRPISKSKNWILVDIVEESSAREDDAE